MQIVYPSTFYSHVHVDIPHELMKHVIGKNGKWFKFTCDKCVVSNIWFNKERSLVEIWGPINNLMTAKYAIENRINVIKNRFDYKEVDDVPKWQKDEYEEISLVDLSMDDKFIGSAITMEHIKMLIGKFGNGFKKITRDSGCSFIWYNSTNKSIQIWGLKDNISSAKNNILENINIIFASCNEE